MEKLICGSIILYRLECPFCGEYNLSGNRKFSCTCCGESYTAKALTVVRREAKQKQEVEIREAIKRQNNCCFYCDHQFGSFYSASDDVIRKLKPVVDYNIPLELNEREKPHLLVVMCNVCQTTKGDRLQFQTVAEEKEWLKYMWAKKISLRKLTMF